MKTSFAALALAVSGAFAYSNGTVYTTEIVNVLTTYCPAATQITQGGKTYTVSSATTLTITDCPCTVTKPIKPTSAPASTVLYTSCPPSASGGSSAPVTKSIPPVVTGTYTNPLTVIYSTPGAGKNGGYASGTGVKPSSPVFTGAATANKVGVVVGAVAGLAALAL